MFEDVQNMAKTAYLSDKMSVFWDVKDTDLSKNLTPSPITLENGVGVMWLRTDKI